MKNRAADSSNLDSLDRFWRRSSFHDASIIEVTAVNKRVVIRLTDLTLVIVGATDLQRCELPTVWLYEKIISGSGRFTLDVETETGHLTVSGTDVRLIRNKDLAVLIPPLDD